MNEMRERLMDIINQTSIELYHSEYDELVDALIDNGVIVPPVKVGQTVWYIEGGYYNSSHKRVREKTVKEINLKSQNGKIEWGFIASGTRYRFKSIGKTVFLTREAAEKALKARENK